MSTFESIVWHILGYAAIPLIFIAGFLITAAVACFLIERLGGNEDK